VVGEKGNLMPSNRSGKKDIKLSHPQINKKQGDDDSLECVSKPAFRQILCACFLVGRSKPITNHGLAELKKEIALEFQWCFILILIFQVAPN